MNILLIDYLEWQGYTNVQIKFNNTNDYKSNVTFRSGTSQELKTVEVNMWDVLAWMNNKSKI